MGLLVIGVDAVKHAHPGAAGKRERKGWACRWTANERRRKKEAIKA